MEDDDGEALAFPSTATKLLEEDQQILDQVKEENDSIRSSSYDDMMRTSVVVVDESERLRRYVETTKIPVASGSGVDGARLSSSSRVECCGSSRSLYCPECCRVLLPPHVWPQSIRNGTLALPFAIDIILGVKERRSSSTGLHIIAISKMMEEKWASQLSKMEEHSTTTSTAPTSTPTPTPSSKERYCRWKRTRLFDLNRVAMPRYSTPPKRGGVFVLFPCAQSVPISTVADQIERLVVLDCKWSTKGGIKGTSRMMMNKNHNVTAMMGGHSGDTNKDTPTTAADTDTGTKNLAVVDVDNDDEFSWDQLPFVHLEKPPKTSLFWRWHHLGEGMLSTIEAVYFAALEVDAASRKKKHHSCNVANNGVECVRRDAGHTDDDTPKKDKREDDMIDIMWLFALQRQMIGNKAKDTRTPAPFTQEGKAHQRELRQRDDGKDAHARQKRLQQEAFYSRLSK